MYMEGGKDNMEMEEKKGGFKKSIDRRCSTESCAWLRDAPFMCVIKCTC